MIRAKLASQRHGTAADRVARVKLACPDFPPDSVEQLSQAIQRIRVQLSLGVRTWFVSVRNAAARSRK